MNNSAAILVIGDDIYDISERVQTVTAHDKDTGELKYRGCGIVIHRFLHVDGDAIVFLKYQGERYIMGKWCKIYTPSDSWIGEYCEYDMRIADKNRTVIIDINHVNKLV